MKLIIDISEEVLDYLQPFKDICYQKIEEGTDSEHEHMLKALYEGTPLPKGHGRLGDLDALEQEMVNGIKAGNYEEGYEEHAHINNMDDCVDCVRYADTIIEADKEDQ